MLMAIFLRAEESKGQEDASLLGLDSAALLGDIHALADSISAALAYCQAGENAVPPPLELSVAQSKDPNDPSLSQFQDLLAWDVGKSDVNPGWKFYIYWCFPALTNCTCRCYCGGIGRSQVKWWP